MIIERVEIQDSRSLEDVSIDCDRLTVIVGRISAYSGKTITWERALHSTLDLAPPEYDWIDLPETSVAMPGKTPLV